MAVPAPPAVLVDGVSLAYQHRMILERLTFTLEAARTTALLGPSGVGKSTLLRIIAGLLPPEAGEVRALDGLPLKGRIALMSQRDNLMPWLDCLANATIGPRLRGEAIDLEKAQAVLERLGLGHRLHARPDELSGGERQRVALARTLIENRSLVLMDEPFSALDALTRARMQDLAGEVLGGRTVLLITHDPLEALRLADRIYVMSGQPVTLAPIAVPEGAPPRSVHGADLLNQQGDLLERLMLSDAA